MSSRVAPDVLQRLTPLLGSIARLVAHGPEPTTTEVTALLLDAGLGADEDAAAEVRYWGELLLALQRQPDDERQAATHTALVRSGLPESSVAEAIALVSRAAVVPAEQAEPAAPGARVLREPLAYLLRAFLARRHGEQLYVAAPAETVAALVQGLTRALPEPFARQITVATATDDIRATQATIVGVSWSAGDGGDPATRDLPEECYREGYALNLYRGRRTELPEHERAVEYATFAAGALAEGDTTQLDTLGSIARSLGVEDVDGLLLVYHLFVAGLTHAALTPDDVTSLLARPRLAHALLPDPAVQEHIIRAASSGGNWWTLRGERAIAALARAAAQEQQGQLRAALATLADAAALRAEDYLDQPDERPARLLFDQLAGLAEPEAHPRRCLRLFQHVAARTAEPPHTVYTAPVRAWLMRKWQEAPPDELDIDELDRWLQAPWHEIDWLLRLPLPEDWRLTATAHALLAYPDQPMRAEDWRVVQQHDAGLREAARELLRAEEVATGVLRFFQALWRSTFPERVEWLVMLLECEVLDPRFYDLLLAQLQLSPAEELLVVEAAPETVLRHTRGTEDDHPARQLIARYLDQITDDDSTRPAALRALEVLATGDWLPIPVRLQAGERLIVTSFERFAGRPPDLSGIERFVHALPRDRLDELAADIVPAMAATIRTQADLERVLDILGPPLVGGRWQLYALLFAALTSRPPDEQFAEVFGAYLQDAVENGAPEALWMEYRRFLVTLDPRRFRQIGDRARSWPDTTRDRWNRFKLELTYLGLR